MGGDQEGSSVLGRLAVPAAFLALLFLQWSLVFHRSPPAAAWEPALHMRAAQKYGADFSQSRWQDLLRPPEEPGRAPSPPLFGLSTAAASSVGTRAGLAPEAGAVWAGLFFLLLLSWSAYLLASDWWGASAGVAAAFLTSLWPPYWDAALALAPDTALAAWVALSYALWEKSRRFTLWRESLGAGLAMAAGALTDAVFLAYAAPIAGAALWEVFRPAESRSRFRAAAALAVPAVLAAPWYAIHWRGLAEEAFRFSSGGPRGLDALFYYLTVFKDWIGWAGLAAAAAGFAWTLFRQARNGWVLASWAASGYIFWTLSPDKDPRRMLPVLPAMALSAAGLPFRAPLVMAAALIGMALWSARGGLWG